MRLLRTETVEAAGNGLGVSLRLAGCAAKSGRAVSCFLGGVGVAMLARHWLRCRGGVARVCEHVRHLYRVCVEI